VSAGDAEDGDCVRTIEVGKSIVKSGHAIRIVDLIKLREFGFVKAMDVYW
jgi:hypothetical protein